MTYIKYNLIKLWSDISCKFAAEIIIMRILSYFLIGTIFLSSCGLNHDKSDRLVEEGITKLYSSEFEEAERLFTEAIEYNPENFEAYYYRGNCKANKRKYQEAIEDFSVAIKYNSGYAQAFANRGQMKFYLNDQEAACEDWKIAESLGMDNMQDKTRHCK